ncbi:hypothetical protein H7X87_03965, partial [Acetobacteraceae bacterium]|nr:hypothetical protein [Candidatus Parcubacteria bacterium]
EVLRAAKAILIIFGRQVSLQGKKYMDGEMGATLTDHVKFALSQGAKNILVINNTSKWGGLKKSAMELYTLRFSKGLRNTIIKDINEFSLCMVADGATILCVSPENLPAGLLTRNKEKLTKTFQRGIADALALEEELRTLL